MSDANFKTVSERVFRSKFLWKIKKGGGGEVKKGEEKKALIVDSANEKMEK